MARAIRKAARACKGSQNGYRNGPLYGVSVAEATMRTYELARKYGVTVQGAVTWAFEFEDQPPFAGFRELATNGIDKPVLNVFQAARHAGQRGRNHEGGWLKTESSGALPLDDVTANSVTGAPDINAVATRNGAEIDVLIWNYHDADVVAPSTPLILTLDGVEAGSLVASEYRVDAEHSNAYRAWQKMGSPEVLTDVQQKELEKAGALEQTVAEHSVSIHSGQVNFGSNVPRQGVLLLRLRER